MNRKDIYEWLQEISDKQDLIINTLQEGREDVKSSSKEIMTVDEVAEYLEKSRQTIYTYVSKRKIPHSKSGGLHFLKSEIDAWIKAGMKKAY